MAAEINDTGLNPDMLKVWSWNPTLLKAIEDRAKKDVAKVRIKKSPVMMLVDSDWQNPSLPQVELPKFEVIDENPPVPSPIIETSWRSPTTDLYEANNWFRINKKNSQVRRFYRLARSGNPGSNYLKSYLVHK